MSSVVDSFEVESLSVEENVVNAPAKKAAVLKIDNKVLSFAEETADYQLEVKNVTKNPVQILNEICAGLIENVTYDVSLDTSGLFLCRVTLNGNIVEFKGPSKKKAKAGAAKAMIHKLIGHEQVNEIFKNKSKETSTTVQVKTKPTMNFVGMLGELCAEKHFPFPTYELLAESGTPPNTSFHVSCTLKDKAVEGEGTSKKRAKQIAAEEMWKIFKIEQAQRVNDDSSAEVNSNNLEQGGENATN